MDSQDDLARRELLSLFTGRDSPELEGENPRTDRWQTDNDIEADLCGSDDSADEHEPYLGFYSTDDDVDDEDNQDSDDPEKPTETPVSVWSTTGQMKSIVFDQKNEFLANPLDDVFAYFNLFFDDPLLAMICKETNAHAKMLLETPRAESESKKLAAWNELEVSELKIFLGLLICMGSSSDFEMLWDPFYGVNFRQQMDMDRFLLIMRCLHFGPETETEDPLYKIRPLVDHFNNKMKDIYYPGRELAADKSFIYWGNQASRRYIRKGNNKYGIKSYILTEPDGLIIRFSVNTSNPNVPTKGYAEKVILELSEDLLDKGHAVYMDTRFNSYSLAKKLLDRNTYCTGRLRKPRKDNPKEVMKKSLKEGETVSMFRDGVHIGRWKKTKECKMTYITTQYENKMVEVVDKRGRVSKKPEAIAQYKKFASVLDFLGEDVLKCNPCEEQPYRWYLKLAIHIFQLMLFNSHKLYNKYSGKPKISIYKYRKSILKTLLPDKNPKPKKVKKRQA